tara:strand:- start:867 stop:1067 length:201 start_codon:yes stop_codon:yes gene_type:complete
MRKIIFLLLMIFYTQKTYSYTGFTNEYMTCDLPVDLIVADICVGSSLGLYILIVIGFAIFGWIVRR